MQFADIFLVATLLVTPSFALVMRDTLPSGYQQTELQWSGAIEEGGPVLRFNGTIESVEQQIKAINPAWVMRNDTNATTIDKRSRDRVFCNIGGYTEIENVRVFEGINYLKGLRGQCGVNARSCARISCSNQAGIWLCNDNNRYIEPTCSYLAQYADTILEQCKKSEVYCPTNDAGMTGPCEWHHFVQGQQFDTDNYNVIVGAAGC